ncbi:MAG: hypothetical protein ABJ004_01060 [Cyclobacteriaceae bacterium]
MDFKSSNSISIAGLAFLILIVLTLSIDYAFETQEGLIKFMLGLTWLLYAVLKYSTFERKRSSSDVFEIKTKNWVTSWFQGAFFLYWFYDEQLTLWVFGGMACILGFITLETFKNYRTTIAINSMGIEELNSNRKIRKSTITEVAFDKDKICVHTTKYRNDLVIKLSDIKGKDKAKAIQSFKDLKDSVEISKNDQLAPTPDPSREGSTKRRVSSWEEN